MKRFAAVMLALVAVVGSTFVANAVRSMRLGEDAAAIERAWTAWALGSSSNPLLRDDFCGEVVDGRFFLKVAVGPGTQELDCQVPAGVEVVATPGGALGWAPTDGKTDTKIFNSTLGYINGIKLKSVKVVVDGATIPRGPMVCAGAFDIDLEPGNSLQQVDPNVTGDSARVVTCGWFHVLPGFTSGEHTVVIAAGYKGSPKFQITFDLTVA